MSGSDLFGDQAANLPVLVAETSPDDETDDKPWKMDWNNGQEVIIREQLSIAVYRNTHDGIVIRQERTWDEEDDTVIVLTTKQAAQAVIDAIKREMVNL